MCQLEHMNNMVGRIQKSCLSNGNSISKNVASFIPKASNPGLSLVFTLQHWVKSKILRNRRRARAERKINHFQQPRVLEAGSPLRNLGHAHRRGQQGLLTGR